MTGTIARTRPKLRAKIPGSSIREVCLVGSPARRYVHLAPAGPIGKGSGPGPGPVPGAPRAVSDNAQGG